MVAWFKTRRAAHPNDIHVWPSPYWSRKSSEDRPRTSAGVGEHFTKYARDLGIDATFHSIRHTFATRWAESGMDLPSLGKLLSHKNLASTQIYVHVEDLHAQRQAKKKVVLQRKAPSLRLVQGAS